MDNQFVLPQTRFMGEGSKIFTQTNSDLSHRLHSHDFYEILYVKQGELTHSFKNSPESLMSMGDCVFIPPNVEHTFYAKKRYSKRDILVDKEFFHQLCSLIPKALNIIQKEFSTRIINFEIDELNALEAMFSKFNQETDIAIRRSLGLTALFTLLNKFLKANATPSTNTLLSKIIEKLNHQKYISNGIATIAQELNYTPQYLCHSFKKFTGTTMTEYVNRIQLTRIEFYLINTNLSLREIADSVGIESLSYMNKLFVKRFGKTPKKYRTEYHKFTNKES